jgi:hypothetical protein
MILKVEQDLYNCLVLIINSFISLNEYHAFGDTHI